MSESLQGIFVVELVIVVLRLVVGCSDVLQPTQSRQLLPVMRYVSISASSAISLPSADQALSVSSAAAEVEVGVSTEMSEWPSLGTAHESLSVGELVGPSLSGFPSRFGLVPSHGTFALDVQPSVVPAAVQHTNLTLSKLTESSWLETNL